MNKITANLLKKIKNPKNRRVTSLMSVGLIAVVGTIILAISSASSLSVSVEPESGNVASCAKSVDDAVASNGKAIKFATCTPGGAGVLGLDPSGRTIPTTDYPIPVGATFMATNGNDSNDGKSVSTPVKTINSAVAKTASGGTIVMRGGEYRDWYTGTTSPGTISKGLTIQAYPKESPWFTGADVVNDGWASDGAGHWSRT